MCTVCSSGDVQTKFYLLQCFLNHVSCYSFNGWCDPFLQVLDIPYLLSIHNVLNVPPQEKKSNGERSGLRGGQGIVPRLPIQASGDLSFKTSVTKQLKWGGAPSCIKITLLLFKFSPCSKYNLFFWEIPRRLSSNCRRFGTHCCFHLHRQVNEVLHAPAYEDGTDSEFRNVGN